MRNTAIRAATTHTCDVNVITLRVLILARSRDPSYGHSSPPNERQQCSKRAHKPLVSASSAGWWLAADVTLQPEAWSACSCPQPQIMDHRQAPVGWLRSRDHSAGAKEEAHTAVNPTGHATDCHTLAQQAPTAAGQFTVGAKELAGKVRLSLTPDRSM
jgi:hypothetical protein